MNTIDMLEDHLDNIKKEMESNKNQVRLLIQQLKYKEKDMDILKESMLDVTKSIQILEDHLGNADMPTKSEPKL